MVDEELLRAWRSIPAESFEPGLSEDELRWAEGHFGFEFPPDLRGLLGEALPLGERFPNWREPHSVTERMWWPWEGLVFDLRHKENIWPASWGERPQDIREQLKIARKWFDDAPTLVPLFAHRYLPTEPCEAGNPVLSVYQLDIICYGGNLKDWVEIEFHKKDHGSMHPCRNIRAWTKVIEEGHP